MSITAIAAAATVTVTQLPIIGMDIAKSVFQLHCVGADGREVRHQLSRAKLMEFFTHQQPSLIVMEACGGAHYWARQLQQLGHEVRLLPAQHVRSFVVGDKTDARDARGVYLAAQQPGWGARKASAATSFGRPTSRASSARLMVGLAINPHTP